MHFIVFYIVQMINKFTERHNLFIIAGVHAAFL